jgi:hypothetical protein
MTILTNNTSARSGFWFRIIAANLASSSVNVEVAEEQKCWIQEIFGCDTFC